MANDQQTPKHILEDDRIFFPEDPEMRLFGSIEKLAQWRHRNRGPAFIRIGRRIGYHGTDLNAYLNAQRTDPNGEAA
ncbi:MerR family transcriptional regulator [Cognatishimia sp. F0-27]|uniref:MerR family transcriptional regulator n=1 Tax=Cognatishimia sp. F0-27 TaxID=2816855 RepID=UPI001D0C53F9|nr:MerR family transcriptional regulator [Cognatishimia sp. F0-27]MCC1494064.1 MerR family transcriptional regulator [Cognatishimia sp. F0-27]